ncbi:two-component system, NtrC family, nitrogen regulation sensor histidine kinase GlnL [Palleronia marisminoris]|uniref:histidine kinase n=1 Tax=Palleronia marisminoris TaxID=315423 RepID=A0A1Y5T9W8_9RHOB|nr:ATP-binding protein [Palleronia marisminoris]SFH35399.1 two-component system, NtrC family, nitrogen regulation sensor histidine kinase GlnL [Palleronia marisminoris]SLN59254.1 Nitrogen regulation protein NR(II) [Palleronia marisminoris]
MTFDGQLWASLPFPALLLDADDRILDVNAAAEDFLMTSAKLLRAAPVFDRIFIDAPLDEAFGRVRVNGGPLFVNTVMVSSGNRPPETCDIQVAPMLGTEGDVLLLLTPQQVAGRLQKAKQARSSARSAIGMAEMLGHEIKNPLAGITGAAQLLAMSLDSADRELTDLIVGECRRIVALIDQVEQFGNLRPPERRAVNLHDILDRTRKSAALGFAAHMRLVAEYDPSLPFAHVDQDQLQQVFLNIIKNSAEAAGPEGGTITVRTFYDHGLRVRLADGDTAVVPLQVEVIDDGPGMPADLMESIFDPFVSGKENGTGLGLALVSKIISDHDGLIAVESRPGRTAFRMSLPLAPDT